MRIPRATERGAILLEHRVEHPQARADHQLEEFGFRVDQEFNERQGPDGGRFNNERSDGLCETSSWRLLVGGLLPRFSHHSCTTSSEEPPLQFSTVSGTSPADDQRPLDSGDQQIRNITKSHDRNSLLNEMRYAIGRGFSMSRVNVVPTGFSLLFRRLNLPSHRSRTNSLTEMRAACQG